MLLLSSADEYLRHVIILLIETAMRRGELAKISLTDIAVVGTFKTGKSSFVNKLAEERLAGVETNPETAAISICRYSEVPRVEVKLLSSAEWARMVDLHEDAPKHPEAYRVAGLYSFNEEMAKRQEKSDKPRDFQPVDIENLLQPMIIGFGNEIVTEPGLHFRKVFAIEARV